LPVERVPTLEFEPVQPLDWTEFTEGWSRLVTAGAVTADQGLEQFIREAGDAPKADYDKQLVKGVTNG